MLVKLIGDDVTVGGEAHALARGDDGELDGAAASGGAPARGDDGELDGAAASGDAPARGDDGELDGAAASGVGGEARPVVGAVGS